MSTKTIVVVFVVFFALVIGTSVLLASTGPKTSPTSTKYSTRDTNKPKAETEKTSFDLGVIKVSEVKQQDYTLKNSGTSPLQILGVSSSCGCTAGQIIYKGEVSKEYSMHAPSEYVTEIAPGDTATVRLTYRPATMPVYGAVEREVYVTTNDPTNQRLIFSISANVTQ